MAHFLQPRLPRRTVLPSAKYWRKDDSYVLQCCEFGLRCIGEESVEGAPVVYHSVVNESCGSPGI